MSEENVNEEREVKTYTQEEVDKLLESETDRRVTQALKTSDAKWAEKLADEVKRAKKEEEELAKMNAKERAEAQLEKDRQAFEEERAALEREKLDVRTRKALRDEGLNEDFASFLMGSNEEESKENIKTFKASLEEAIAQGVKEQLKGQAPEVGGGTEALSKADIMAIKDPYERQRKIAENMNLFD